MATRVPVRGQAASRARSTISAPAGPVPLAVVILTRNEEENLPHALASVIGWAAEVWVVDAHSTDRTAAVAEAAGAQVVTHEFTGFTAQRNWALRALPVRQEWLLFLDADEVVTPELRTELAGVLAAPPAGVSLSARGRPADGVAGYYMKRRFIFLGRWLRHGGYYPIWLLRAVRHRLARCEERGVDEHLLVDGPTARLGHDLLHEDRRPLSRWVERHTRYADLAAADLLLGSPGESAPADARASRVAPRWWSGRQAERTRWWYERVYRRLPLGARAVPYFFYRYLLRGGFLDGREGFIYHVLQALWYRVLVDAKILEARCGAQAAHGSRVNGSPDPGGVR